MVPNNSNDNTYTYETSMTFMLTEQNHTFGVVYILSAISRGILKLIYHLKFGIPNSQKCKN